MRFKQKGNQGFEYKVTTQSIIPVKANAFKSPKPQGAQSDSVDEGTDYQAWANSQYLHTREKGLLKVVLWLPRLHCGMCAHSHSIKLCFAGVKECFSLIEEIQWVNDDKSS